MSGGGLYWKFDDRNPAFAYGPGWSNRTDPNAHESTLSYTSEKTNVTIQFYGEAMWLFGAIGRTQDWNRPVSRYTLDNRYISTVVAEIENDTSYNELFAYFHNLSSSYHMLVVENVNEGATLFLDYYLVEPIPRGELAQSVGSLQAGGKPLSTSILEHPMVVGAAGLSEGAAIGSLIGAVVGGISVAFLIAFVVFIVWRRRGGSKPYYYKPAAAHEVLFEELKPGKSESEGEIPVALTVTPYPSSPPATYDSPESVQRSPPTRTRTVMSRSSIYSLGSDRVPTSPSFQQTYFPLPSEYQSQDLLSKSMSITRSKRLSHSESLLLSQSPTMTLYYSASSSSARSGPLSKEQRPLLQPEP